MSSAEIVRAQYGFNRAMNERLWKIIMEHLTDEQFVQELDYSRGSIRSQLIHMANAQRFWFQGLLGAPRTDELNAEDFPTREAACLICQQVDQESVDQANRLTETDLERVPDNWSEPVWVGLIQNSHHSTDHRAQILRALHDLGLPTFEQNFALSMEHAVPMTADALVGHIEQSRAKWDDMLRQISTDQMGQPVIGVWTVRDVVAILTWKENQVIDMIRNRTVSEASFGELPQAEQSDLLAASRALPLAALLAQHQAIHIEMLDVIRTLTEDDLNSEDVSGLPPDERFWKAIAGATWWSYPGLIKPIRKLLSA